MTEEFFSEYSAAYPFAGPYDYFKLIYHSRFGCEHLVTSFEKAVELIEGELTAAHDDRLPVYEDLPGQYCRVHLSVMGRGLSPETFARIFVLSSEREESRDIGDELQSFLSAVRNGGFSFSYENAVSDAKDWENAGFPPVHHTEAFRSAYHPAYRVIKKKYARLIPLLCEIDRRLQEGVLTAALDGRCASGKTTAARALSEIYRCAVFHTDDFFLPREKKTPERLNTPGGNFDRERFLKQVLIPLSEGKTVEYVRYNCHSGKYEEPLSVQKEKLNIIEGSYSCHPDLYPYYELTAFFDIPAETQKKRILERNPGNAERFFSEWIPLEERYFSFYDIKNNAPVVIGEEPDF